MSISYWLMLGCFGTALLLTVVVESRAARLLGERASACLAMGAFLCCYGVCIGLVSALLAYFFHIREWITLLVAAPLAVLVLLAAAWMGEQ